MKFLCSVINNRLTSEISALGVSYLMFYWFTSDLAKRKCLVDIKGDQLGQQTSKAEQAGIHLNFTTNKYLISTMATTPGAVKTLLSTFILLFVTSSWALPVMDLAKRSTRNPSALETLGDGLFIFSKISVSYWSQLVATTHILSTFSIYRLISPTQLFLMWMTLSQFSAMSW